MKNFPPKRVLAAVDFSPASRSALDAAKALARRWGASLELVHVRVAAPAAVWVGPEAVPIPAPEPPSESERRAEERLMREAAAGFPEARLTARTTEGWPPSELAALAVPREADLAVLGTHGYAGLERALMGSVAEAVLRRAEIPVLAVHESRVPLKVARILAPWSGRPYATRALRYAGALAQSLGADLRVLRVVPSGLEPDETDAGLERRLDGILGPGGPSWTLRVRAGEPRAQIVSEANSGRYGMVVVSAHRRPFSADVVLGSTVERLLRHSRVPVLGVPSGRPGRAR